MSTQMSLRKILIPICCILAFALYAPATFASGCGEICIDEVCEDGGDPYEGCIQKRFFCLDLLCYSATPASCETSSADVGEMVDDALVGVDLNDREAVAKALEALPTPVRLNMGGEVLFQTPGFEIEKEKLRTERTGEASQVAAVGLSEAQAQQH